MSSDKKLTDKVSYSDILKNELSDEEVELINMLAEKEPSCYADIAVLMVDYAKDQTLKTLDVIEDRISDYLESPSDNFEEYYQNGIHRCLQIIKELKP